VLRVLDGLQTGGLCPESWAPTEATIDPATALRPNSVVGQYRIEAQLGSGTHAVVFRAHDQVLKRTVALKVFRPTASGAPRRLLEEARAAAALNHPNVCTVFSVDESAGLSMIVMEHVDGQPLKRTLENEKLGRDDAIVIARQIALGMGDAHAHQIVHGDLK